MVINIANMSAPGATNVSVVKSSKKDVTNSNSTGSQSELKQSDSRKRKRTKMSRHCDTEKKVYRLDINQLVQLTSKK